MKDKKLIGRQWSSNQEDSSIFKDYSKVPVFINNHCSRCGSKVTACLPNGKKYCRGCME